MDITLRLLQKTSDLFMNIGYIFLSTIVFPALLSQQQTETITLLGIASCVFCWILSYYLDIQYSIRNGGIHVYSR